MDIDCDLTVGPAFVYRAEDPQGHGVEHEYDAILLGTYSGDPHPDPAEVAAWKWIDLDQLRTEMAANPKSYAPWVHLGLPMIVGG